MISEDGVGDTNTTIQGKELYELEVRFKSHKFLDVKRMKTSLC